MATTGTTLYYPFIHPRDANHLKAAMVYWDRVRRIVPASMMFCTGVDGDDDDAKILTDGGLLVSTEPEPYEAAAADMFFRHVEPNADLFQIDKETARELAARNRGMHIEKFGHKVFGRLHDLGIAHKFGDWVTMHDEIGAFYMFCLASEMSEKMTSPLLTDSRDEAEMGQSMLFSPQPGEDVSDMLLKVGIRLPKPEQLQHVPMERMAQFSKDRAAERQEFRSAVEALVDATKAFNDPNAINDYLATQRIRIEAAVKNLLKTLDELGVGAISGVAKITVPAGLGAAIAALPFSPEAAAILAGLGLVISGISCYAETRGKLRQARTSSQYHYLLSIEKDLGIPAHEFRN
jgi:hypothetical protein